MPVESRRFPEPAVSDAIATAPRAAAELEAHDQDLDAVPPEPVAAAAAFGVPVILAAGEFAEDIDTG
jgi:hypothetical protein